MKFDAESPKFTQVASTRPIPFSEDSVIFELRDGRVSCHPLQTTSISNFPGSNSN